MTVSAHASGCAFTRCPAVSVWSWLKLTVCLWLLRKGFKAAGWLLVFAVVVAAWPVTVVAAPGTLRRGGGAGRRPGCAGPRPGRC